MSMVFASLDKKAWDLQPQISLTVFLLPHMDIVMVSLLLTISTWKIKNNHMWY